MQERRILYFPKDAIPLTAKTLFNYNTGVADVASGMTAGLTIHNLYIPFKYNVVGTTQNTPSPSSWTSNIVSPEYIIINTASQTAQKFLVNARTNTGMSTSVAQRVGTVFYGASTQSYNKCHALFPTSSPGSSSTVLSGIGTDMYVKFPFGSSPITTRSIASGTNEFSGGSKVYYFKEPSGPLYYD